MLNFLVQKLSSIGISGDLLTQASFYLIALLTVFFAYRIVVSRNIFHSAIFLALALIGVAGVYIYLDAEFLAAAQILIYVGAIVILFLFAIMLTENIHDRTIKQANQQAGFSALETLALFYFLINIIKRKPWVAVRAGEYAPFGLEQLGEALVTTYALPFEIISLLLLAALVGAIVLGRRQK